MLMQDVEYSKIFADTTYIGITISFTHLSCSQISLKLGQSSIDSMNKSGLPCSIIHKFQHFIKTFLPGIHKQTTS